MGLKPGDPKPAVGPGEENGDVFGIDGAAVGLKALGCEPTMGRDEEMGMLV